MTTAILVITKIVLWQPKHTWAHDIRLPTSCAQVQGLPQSHCGGNREGTLRIEIRATVRIGRLEVSTNNDYKLCYKTSSGTHKQ